MTHELLQSDIDTARRLMADGRSDGEIVAVLLGRRVVREQAEELVEALLQGKRVSPRLSFLVESPVSPQGVEAEPRLPEAKHSPAAAPVPAPPAERHSHRAHHHRRRGPALSLRWVSILLGLLALLSGLVVGWHRYHAATRALLEQLDSLTPELERSHLAGSDKSGPLATAPGSLSVTNSGEALARYRSLLDETAARKLSAGEERRLETLKGKFDGLTLETRSATPGLAVTPATAAPALELRQDGLHLAGRQITTESALATLQQILGAPTRTNLLSGTNLLGRPERVVYAYDRHGLLLYSPQDSGQGSLVLDCEASGGTNGTASAFAGALRIGNEVVRSDTDSKALAAIKPLGLTRLTNDSDIFTGHYGSLGLSFAYLKTSRHLSLVEIDFK